MSLYKATVKFKPSPRSFLTHESEFTVEAPNRDTALVVVGGTLCKQRPGLFSAHPGVIVAVCLDRITPVKEEAPA